MLPEHIEGAVLITKATNQRYFHHLTMAQGAIYLSAGHRVFFSWGRSISSKLPGDPEIREIREEELGREVAALLREESKEYLMVEKELPIQIYQLLLGAGIQDIRIGEGFVEQWRETKTPWEIEQLSEACRITEFAFDKILEVIKPGMTELEVAAKLEYWMRLQGCEEFNKTIVASGIHSAKPHHWPTNKPLEKGDFVTMDYGCTVNGYHSDMTRTIILGRATDRQKLLYETVRVAQEKAREVLREGRSSGEMDGVARRIIDESEFRGCFLHNLGHGIGLDIHEGTGLVQGSKAILTEGMVVSIEPGIYVEGYGGVRIEDIAVVEKSGCRVLENAPRELIEV